MVSGELPAGKDYFVLITGLQQNDPALDYIAEISVVPEPVTYVMFLAGLGLMGFIVGHRKQMI
jgi:hypothetical protein